jgi:hypothetical protein
MQDQFAKLAASKPSMATVRQMQNIAMTARSLGPEFQQFANEVIKEAGRIKDSVGDMRAEIGYFASDTRRLDAVLGGVQGLAGAFSAVEGAHAALAAGCDMVLICNSPDKADQLLDGLDTKRILDAKRSAARLSALLPTAHADDWATLQQNETYKAAKKLVKTIT